MRMVIHRKAESGHRTVKRVGILGCGDVLGIPFRIPSSGTLKERFVGESKTGYSIQDPFLWGIEERFVGESKSAGSLSLTSRYYLQVGVCKRFVQLLWTES